MPWADFCMTRQNPGADYNTETAQSVVGASSAPVSSYTEFVYVRVRGRQMAFRIGSDTIGTQWQLGAPRVDVRPDGRKV